MNAKETEAGMVKRIAWCLKILRKAQRDGTSQTAYDTVTPIAYKVAVKLERLKSTAG